MSLSNKVRQTINAPVTTTKFTSLRQTSIGSQRHYCDYYTFTDAPSKGKNKRKTKKPQQQIGSVHDHAQSLQKLQIAIQNRNKQIIQIVQETSKLKAENQLMRNQVKRPKNELEEKYISYLADLEQELQSVLKEEQLLQKKKTNKLNKLYEQKKNIQNKLNDHGKRKGKK